MFLLIFITAAWAQEPSFPSAHNFTLPGVKPPELEAICVYCHLPEETAKTEKIKTLWPALELVTEPEAERTLKKIKLTNYTPGTRNCLGCHDGVLAKNSWKHNEFQNPETQGITVFQNPPWGRLVEYPPSVDYPLRRYEHPLRMKVVFTQSRMWWIGPPPADAPVKLGPDGTIQCITCHDQHSQEFKPLLVADFTEGRLCLNCHRKNP